MMQLLMLFINTFQKILGTNNQKLKIITPNDYRHGRNNILDKGDYLK